jgi:hypothetical protein
MLWTAEIYETFVLLITTAKFDNAQIVTAALNEVSRCAAPCPVVTHSEMNVEFFGPNAQELGGQAILG